MAQTVAEVQKGSKLHELAMAYKALKEKQKSYEGLAEETKGLAVTANEALRQHMEAIGMQNFMMDDSKFYIQTVSSAKIVEGKKPEVIEWMKQDPEGKELVKEDIPSKTLSSFLFERYSEGGTLPPKELVEDPAKWTGRVVKMSAAK